MTREDLAIGELLDRWELMNNDLRSDIKKYDFAFYMAIQELYRIRNFQMSDCRDDYYEFLCPTCGGEGEILQDCFEDTCCCADPEEHGYIL